MKDLTNIFKAVGSTADWSRPEPTSVNQTNALGDTPLHFAAGWGDSDAVRTLIEAGANVNAQGEYKMTPLFSAITAGSAEIVEILLDAGADPSLREEGCFNGVTPLEFAQINKKKPDAGEIIKLLTRATAEAREEK